MFIRPCTVFSIAAVRGVVKPDISVVKMSTLVTVIWISYNQKDIETVGYITPCSCSSSRSIRVLAPARYRS